MNTVKNKKRKKNKTIKLKKQRGGAYPGGFTPGTNPPPGTPASTPRRSTTGVTPSTLGATATGVAPPPPGAAATGVAPPPPGVAPPPDVPSSPQAISALLIQALSNTSGRLMPPTEGVRLINHHDAFVRVRDAIDELREGLTLVPNPEINMRNEYDIRTLSRQDLEAYCLQIEGKISINDRRLFGLDEIRGCFITFSTYQSVVETNALVINTMMHLLLYTTSLFSIVYDTRGRKELTQILIHTDSPVFTIPIEITEQLLIELFTDMYLSILTMNPHHGLNSHPMITLLQLDTLSLVRIRRFSLGDYPINYALDFQIAKQSGSDDLKRLLKKLCYLPSGMKSFDVLNDIYPYIVYLLFNDVKYLLRLLHQIKILLNGKLDRAIFINLLYDIDPVDGLEVDDQDAVDMDAAVVVNANFLGNPQLYNYSFILNMILIHKFIDLFNSLLLLHKTIHNILLNSNITRQQRSSYDNMSCWIRVLILIMFFLLQTGGTAFSKLKAYFYLDYVYRLIKESLARNNLFIDDRFSNITFEIPTIIVDLDQFREYVLSDILLLGTLGQYFYGMNHNINAFFDRHLHDIMQTSTWRIITDESMINAHFALPDLVNFVPKDYESITEPRELVPIFFPEFDPGNYRSPASVAQMLPTQGGEHTLPRLGGAYTNVAAGIVDGPRVKRLETELHGEITPEIDAKKKKGR